MSKNLADFFAPMLPAERRAIFVVACIAICRMLGLFALLPVLAIYAATLDNATPLLIGLAVGAYGLTQAALQIPFGALSDRIGRIPVIVTGLVLFAAGSVLAAESTTIHGVIAGRLLQGAGAISATLAALLADATRPEMRTRAMALFGVGIGASFLLALVAGPMLAAEFGVQALFWFAAALAVIAAVLLLFLPRGIKRPEPAGQRRLRSAIRPDLLQLDFYIFLLHALLTASFVALPFVLRNQLDLLLVDHWKIYIGALLASLLGTVPLIVRDERRGKSATIAIALALLMVGQLLLALLSYNVIAVFVALAIFFAGFNFLEAGLPARLSIQAGGEVRGASLGVFSSAQFAGAFAGGLIGGRLLDSGNPSTIFVFGAVTCALWVALNRILKMGE